MQIQTVGSDIDGPIAADMSYDNNNFDLPGMFAYFVPLPVSHWQVQVR